MDITGKLLIRDLSVINRSTVSSKITKKGGESEHDVFIGNVRLIKSNVSDRMEHFFTIVDLVRSCSDVRGKKIQLARKNLSDYLNDEKKIREYVLLKLVDEIHKIL